MRYEITGCFEAGEDIPALAGFAMKWIERMHRSAAEREWALYRADVQAMAAAADVHLGAFEAFPDCRFDTLPVVVFKDQTIRVRLETMHEEDVDAVEDLLTSLGAESIEVDEQIDPTRI